MDRQAQIADLIQRGLNKRLEDNLSFFNQKFARLKELLSDLPTKENITEAYFLFDFIIDTVPLMVNIIGPGFLFRAQANKQNEIFNTQTRISYNKLYPKDIPFGKFNTPEDAMFYGCLSYDCLNYGEYILPGKVAAFECCKDLKLNPQNNLLQDITLGRWQIREKLNVVNLCFDPLHLEHNYELKEACNLYLEDIRSCYSLEAFEFITELLKYYSRLCTIGSNERAYYILTAFFDAIRNYYSTNDNIIVQGIISPSSITNGKGLNIVLLPTVVDNNLYLDSVCMYRYYLNSSNDAEHIVYPITETIYNLHKIPNFNFQFDEDRYIKPAPRYLHNINN